MQLYRGFDTNINEGIYDNIFLSNKRNPKHTSLFIHEVADNWFLRTFGVNARSRCIFCTPDVHEAQKYSVSSVNGTLAIIHPVGECRFIFSENVDDFNMHVDEMGTTEQDIVCWLNQQNYKIVDKIEDIPSDFKGEIMLCCNKFSTKIIPNK